MIGIVILGLGLVMVATMFPVAWTRARTLNEYTVQRVITNGAHATVKSLVRVSGPSIEAFPNAKDASSFLGDLICDRLNQVPISACPAFPSDTWVHPLNLENILVTPPGDDPFVSENLWEMQDPDGVLRYYGDPDTGELSGDDVVENSYFRRQLTFHQRIYPPMPRLPAGASSAKKDAWYDHLATRRFCSAVFHRLRTRISGTCTELQGLGATRSFDMYYVTLRRPRPTNRYARQDPDFVPNPCDLTQDPVIPHPMEADTDLMFPVPWRVQVQFLRKPPLGSRDNATGIPTEIKVPPPGITDTGTKVMLVHMFPSGARFIDEVTGDVFRVIKRRLTGNNADEAILTLDREVFLEDITLNAGDTRCGVHCENDRWEHYVRTVWVFPPAVQSDSGARRRAGGALTFQGSQPVVSIEVRTLNIAPTR